MSGRVFGIFPSYPLSLHGYCLRSLECVEGACIVRRPSYMHHPPIDILLGVNPVHLILAFFVLREPLRPGPRAPSIPASCIRSYDFAPLRVSVHYRRDRRPLMERAGERRGDGDADGIWKKRSKTVLEKGTQGKHEISRTKGATAVRATTTWGIFQD